MVGLQPSLFTRLALVESELRAMKDMLAEMKVNQDELRQDRDEWRRAQPSLRRESVGRVAAEITLLCDRIGGEEERRPGSRLRTVDQDPTRPV